MFAMPVDQLTSLSLLEEHHAEELYAAVDANRAHLRQWLPWVDLTHSPEDSRAFIRASLQQFATRNGLACAVRHRGALVGVIGLHQVNWADRATSIGYWLVEQAQGQGLITQGCATLLDYLFDGQGLNRVVIECATGNARSCAVPERLGFTKEGIQRERQWLHDRFLDIVLYGMTAAEWRRRRSSSAAGLGIGSST